MRSRARKTNIAMSSVSIHAFDGWKAVSERTVKICWVILSLSLVYLLSRLRES